MLRVLFVCLALQASSAASLVIKAGYLVDVLEGKVLENTVVLAEGESIKAVGPNVQTPPGAKVLDLSSAWALPVLIDCHSHVTFQRGHYYDDLFRKSRIDDSVNAHVD